MNEKNLFFCSKFHLIDWWIDFKADSKPVCFLCLWLCVWYLIGFAFVLFALHHCHSVSRSTFKDFKIKLIFFFVNFHDFFLRPTRISTKKMDIKWLNGFPTNQKQKTCPEMDKHCQWSLVCWWSVIEKWKITLFSQKNNDDGYPFYWLIDGWIYSVSLVYLFSGFYKPLIILTPYYYFSLIAVVIIIIINVMH